MKIFISWSGKASKSAALVMRRWFQDVLQYSDPFVSSVDIAMGQRWEPEILAQLAASDFGIVCLTPSNMAVPWVLFEAGAISNKFREGRVCALLIGLAPTDVRPPLSQFQHAKIERDELFKLMTDVNAYAPKEKQLDADRLQRALKRHWDDFEKELKGVSQQVADEVSAAGRAPTRTIDSLVEETLETVRAIERRLAALPGEVDVGALAAAYPYLHLFGDQSAGNKSISIAELVSSGMLSGKAPVTGGGLLGTRPLPEDEKKKK